MTETEQSAVLHSLGRAFPGLIGTAAAAAIAGFLRLSAPKGALLGGALALTFLVTVDVYIHRTVAK